MASTTTSGGPPPPMVIPPGVDLNNLDTRQPILIAMMAFFTALTFVFVIWRLAVVWHFKGRLQLSDYLIFIAFALNCTGNIATIKSSFKGQGHHSYDPSISPQDVMNCLRNVFIGQVCNLYSMFFLKASITAYLILLNFSKAYRIIIWISLAIIIVGNLMIPAVTLFGSCRPLSLRWNKMQPGECWPPVVDSATGYIQASTNIVTDITYSAAPLVYLSSVQLPKSTQWGLRGVFLFCLLGTGCSVAKMTQLHVLTNSKDPLWDSVNLSLFSVAEVGIGIFAACLPPLRSFFNKWLRRIFPTTLTGSKSRTHLYDRRSFEMKKPHDSGHHNHQPPVVEDYSSERSILPDQELDKDGITKTVNVAVSEEENTGNYRRTYADDFRSPRSVPLHVREFSENPYGSGRYGVKATGRLSPENQV